MKKLVKSATLLAMAMSAGAQAGTESIKVLCTDGENWDWIPNFSVVGERVQTIQEFAHGYDIMSTFSVDEVFYNAAKSLCENYYPQLPFPQPLKGRTDEWYSFSVEGFTMQGRNETRRPFNRFNELHRKALDAYYFETPKHLIAMLGEEDGIAYYNERHGTAIDMAVELDLDEG